MDNNEKLKENKKGELLKEINSFLEVLPICDCKEIKDYILELYLT